MRRDLGTALIAASVLVAPALAEGANDQVARLEYHSDAQDGCIGEDELRRMVASQLGHDPFRPDADRRVAVTIAKAGAGFEGRIVWTEADGRPLGERLLSSRSRDCAEIAANVAFAIVVQLQLVERDAADAAGPTGEAPPADVGAKGEDPRVASPELPERPRAPEEVRDGSPGVSLPQPWLNVGLGSGVGLGLAPQPAAFGRLFVAARWPRFSAELAADGALPTVQREPDGTGARVSPVGASAAGCAHVSLASACLLGRLGWLRARGVDVAAPRTSWGRFAQVGVRLAASKEVGRFVFTLHADGLVMLSHWDVVLNDAVIWSVPRIGVLLGLDLGRRFF